MSKIDYKQSGYYIREVDVRNKDLKVKSLLGGGISKEFILPISNIIGTDVSLCRVVEL